MRPGVASNETIDARGGVDGDISTSEGVRFEDIPPRDVLDQNKDEWEDPEEIRGNVVKDAYPVSKSYGVFP